MTQPTTLGTAPDPTREPQPPTPNERALAGLAWLAATMPTLTAQDCLTGKDITALTVYSHEVRIHFCEVATAERVAARLGLTDWTDHVNDEHRQQWWAGEVGDVPVTVVHVELFPHSEPSTSTYRCERCGAAFGVTGQSTGCDEDGYAEEYFEVEVARHESGECTPAVAS